MHTPPSQRRRIALALLDSPTEGSSSICIRDAFHLVVSSAVSLPFCFPCGVVHSVFMWFTVLAFSCIIFLHASFHFVFLFQTVLLFPSVSLLAFLTFIVLRFPCRTPFSCCCPFHLWLVLLRLSIPCRMDHGMEIGTDKNWNGQQTWKALGGSPVRFPFGFTFRAWFEGCLASASLQAGMVPLRGVFGFRVWAALGPHAHCSLSPSIHRSGIEVGSRREENPNGT